MQNNDTLDGSLSQKAMFFINYETYKRSFSQKKCLFIPSMSEKENHKTHIWTYRRTTTWWFLLPRLHTLKFIEQKHTQKRIKKLSTWHSYFLLWKYEIVLVGNKTMVWLTWLTPIEGNIKYRCFEYVVFERAVWCIFELVFNVYWHSVFYIKYMTTSLHRQAPQCLLSRCYDLNVKWPNTFIYLNTQSPTGLIYYGAFKRWGLAGRNMQLVPYISL